MKIKALAALVKETGILNIYNVVDAEGVVTQWAGDIKAIYPLHGYPIVDASQLLRMMDIPEKDHKKYATQTLENAEIMESFRPKFNEYWDGESDDADLRLDSSIIISWMDDHMYILYGQDGQFVCALQTSLLKPLSKAEDEPRFFRRGDIIAIKQGLLLAGLVSPIRLSIKSSFTDKLIELGSQIQMIREDDKT